MSQESYSHELTRFPPLDARHVKPRLSASCFSVHLADFPCEIVTILMHEMELDSLLSFALTCTKLLAMAQKEMPLWNTLLACAAQTTLEQTKQRLLAKLNRLPEGLPTRLLTLIKRQGGLLAGGSVLEALLDSTFEGTDLDIYLKAAPGMDQAMALVWLRELMEDMEQSLNADKEDKVVFVRRRHKYSAQVLALVEFFVGNQKIQVMAVDCNGLQDMQDFVMQSFDLSFCQCWFDGDQVGVSGNLKRTLNRVGTARWDNLALRSAMKQCNDSFDPLYLCMLERIEKYKRRGLTIKEPITLAGCKEPVIVKAWTSAYNADWFAPIVMDLERGIALMGREDVAHKFEKGTFSYEHKLLKATLKTNGRHEKCIIRAEVSLAQSAAILSLLVS